MAAFLLPWYLLFPRLAASEVYQQWSALSAFCAPSCHDVRAIHRLQVVYAPLRWPVCVSFVRSAFGSDLFHYEHRIRGIRLVVISPEPLDVPKYVERSRLGASRSGFLVLPRGTHDDSGFGAGSRRASGGASPGGASGSAESTVLERPTVLFVPGGAFIADFEVADNFFLYRWVREARVIVLYATYEFAPQAPYPTGMLQVAAIYRALREGSHDHVLGFRVSPLVVAGLSAGGNIAVSSILSILQPQLLARSTYHPPSSHAPHQGGGVAASPTIVSSSSTSGLFNPSGQPSTQGPSVPMPDALLLVCPVLNLNRSPSPSRVAFASDTLLPQPLLTACAKAYDGGVDNAMWCEPLLSPALAPDEVLRRLPLTNVQVGGFDPLLDDSVDFNTRIRRLGVPGELRIHRTLPHTFFSFPIWHAIPEVQQAFATSVQWIEDVLWDHGRRRDT